MRPILRRAFSGREIQFRVLFLSNMNSKNNIIKNVPPNDDIPTLASSRWRAYSSGLCNAKPKTVLHGKSANTATITIGNTNLIPNTAIAMPHVRNRCLHLCDIFSSFVAFITALSKDRLTSRTLITSAVSKKLNPNPDAVASPRQNARIIPPSKMPNDHSKYLIISLNLFKYVSMRIYLLLLVIQIKSTEKYF